MNALARDIVVRLQQAGHVAYFAGGCVRDQLLGIEAKDCDVATSATPASALRANSRGAGRAHKPFNMCVSSSFSSFRTFPWPAYKRPSTRHLFHRHLDIRPAPTRPTWMSLPSTLAIQSRLNTSLPLSFF